MNFRKRYKNENKTSKYLVILFSIFVVLFFYYKHEINKSLISENQTIEIQKWETYYSLSNKLDISNTILKIYLKFNTPDKSIKAWIYNISSWDNIQDIIEKLQLNQVIKSDMNLTILEGWNMYDIDKYLTDKWLINSGDFIEKATNFNKTLINKYPFLINTISLEWFLYPDTYSIEKVNFNLDKFIDTQLSNFKTRVYDKILFSFGNKEILNIINLSSIVEKEERDPLQKAIVAWILKKRLEENWYLWADATVCYPHKITREICTPSFVINHIYEKNSYNTRTLLWLPLSPISNPSLETIEATVNSKVTPYYYYLHDNNWEIHYATTNLEHERNKSLYLK